MDHCLRFLWNEPQAAEGFRSAVSLHSHTMFSRESLEFIPRIAARIPALQFEVNRLASRFRQRNGCELDFSKGWWTPPLGPREAEELERSQIRELGCEPMVSLTDHDDLRAHQGSETAAVELTVPLRPSFVHLGLHNLPAGRAAECLALGGTPDELMEWLGGFPNVLVVLNHPFWDEAEAGQAAHKEMVSRLLQRHAGGIHALELNGLRPWSENRDVVDLARHWNLPVISGGDRHCAEPNANVNLTQARSFDEFAWEIRREKRSTILFLQQYRRRFALRILSHVLDVFQTYPYHPLRWTRWSQRAFYEMRPGEVRSLASYWPGNEPALIRLFVSLLTGLRPTHDFAVARFSAALAQECQP